MFRSLFSGGTRRLNERRHGFEALIKGGPLPELDWRFFAQRAGGTSEMPAAAL